MPQPKEEIDRVRLKGILATLVSIILTSTWITPRKCNNNNNSRMATLQISKAEWWWILISRCILWIGPNNSKLVRAFQFVNLIRSKPNKFKIRSRGVHRLVETMYRYTLHLVRIKSPLPNHTQWTLMDEETTTSSVTLQIWSMTPWTVCQRSKTLLRLNSNLCLIR